MADLASSLVSNPANTLGTLAPPTRAPIAPSFAMPAFTPPGALAAGYSRDTAPKSGVMSLFSMGPTPGQLAAGAATAPAAPLPTIPTSAPVAAAPTAPAAAAAPAPISTNLFAGSPLAPAAFAPAAKPDTEIRFLDQNSPKITREQADALPMNNGKGMTIIRGGSGNVSTVGGPQQRISMAQANLMAELFKARPQGNEYITKELIRDANAKAAAQIAANPNDPVVAAKAENDRIDTLRKAQSPQYNALDLMRGLGMPSTN